MGVCMASFLLSHHYHNHRHVSLVYDDNDGAMLPRGLASIGRWPVGRLAVSSVSSLV